MTEKNNDEEIKNIEADLTIVGGKIVYAKGDFSSFSPPPIPILPDWSPTLIYNGYYPGSNNLGTSAVNIKATKKDVVKNEQHLLFSQVHQCAGSCDVHGHNHNVARKSDIPLNNFTAFWGALGCSCFAF